MWELDSQPKFISDLRFPNQQSLTHHIQDHPIQKPYFLGWFIQELWIQEFHSLIHPI